MSRDISTSISIFAQAFIIIHPDIFTPIYFFYPFLAACNPLNKKTTYLISVAVLSFLIMFTFFNSYNSNFLLFFLARSFAHKRNICLPCVILFYFFLNFHYLFNLFCAVFVMSDINRFSMVTLHFLHEFSDIFSSLFHFSKLDVKHKFTTYLMCHQNNGISKLMNEISFLI